MLSSFILVPSLQLMPEEFLPQFLRVIGKRLAGRLHTSWLATVKNDLSYHNLSVEDAIELALDRPLWRLIIIIIIISTKIFTVLSLWQSHCESSLGSRDEYIRRQVAADLWTKPIGLGRRSACI